MPAGTSALALPSSAPMFDASRAPRASATRTPAKNSARRLPGAAALVRGMHAGWLGATFRVAVSVSAIGALLVGCSASPSAPDWSDSAPVTVLTEDARAQRIAASGWIESGTHIVAVREGSVQGDMRKVAVDVTGDPSGRRRFSYRFDWYDAAGMPAGTQTTALSTVSIKPRETITLTSVAPAAAATQWRLVIVGRP